VGLDRRAADGPERAKDAAVGAARTQREATTLALVGNDAGIFRHAFLLAVAAFGAREDGFELHGLRCADAPRGQQMSSGRPLRIADCAQRTNTEPTSNQRVFSRRVACQLPTKG